VLCSLLPGAGHGEIRVLLDDGPACPVGVFAEGAELILDGLIVRCARTSLADLVTCVQHGFEFLGYKIKLGQRQRRLPQGQDRQS